MDMGIQERKEREKERRRQQILVAAKRVFSEKGYTRATMEDIANAAELSPGTLYLYFKNKEELFASLSLRILQYMTIRLEQVKNDTGTCSKDKLEALKAAMFDVYGFDSASIISMLHLQSSETLRNLSPQVLSEFDRLSGVSMDILANIFNEGIAEGAFINFPSKALADSYWSLFSGVILWEASKQIMDKSDKDMRAALDFALDLFKRGISVGREK
jgi:AcrR family transcriptional regulator